MKTQSLGLWWLRLVTFLMAALAAGSAAYWVLKWSATPASGVNAPAISRSAPTDPSVVARLLGGAQTAVAALADTAASRFKLMGVVTTGASTGYALISVDGKPARPYRVGAAVNDSLVLHSLAPRSAALAPKADAPASFTLELPALTTGSASPATNVSRPVRSRASRSSDSSE
jgi:general secretion pathway protein C